MQRMAIISTQVVASNTRIMADLLLSGILERFPMLEVVSVESGLGWIPFLLEAADHQFKEQQLMREKILSMKPSDYFHRQCYANFWFEEAGIKMRHLIGVENILWESDFPHSTSTWPESWNFIERTLKGVPQEERYPLMVGNAMKLYKMR